MLTRVKLCTLVLVQKKGSSRLYEVVGNQMLGEHHIVN